MRFKKKKLYKGAYIEVDTQILRWRKKLKEGKITIAKTPHNALECPTIEKKDSLAPTPLSLSREELLALFKPDYET